MAEQYERFIDADEQESYAHEIVSYESIVVKQIQKCVDILSQEEAGGYFKQSKYGTEKYVEDVKEQIINSVETLRMLLTPFAKGNKKEVDDIRTEIKDYKKEMGNRRVNIRGKGEVKISELKMLEKTSPFMKEITDFKCQKYRELFEVLVCIYNKRKMEIAAASIDG